MKVRTILLVLIYVFLVICLTPVVFFFMIFGIRDPLISIGKWAMRLSQLILGLRLDVSGLEHAGHAGAHIFMPNHLSFLDGPMMVMLIPQPVRVILKKEVFRIPIVGSGMRQADFVAVDRKGTKGGQASIERAARLMRDKGYSFLVFPEGTRSLDGNLQRFRRGGFFLALESGAPIVPISIKGTFELMPKGHLFPKKGCIRVVFHPAISVQGYSRDNLPELMDKVRESIQSGLSREGK
jgi:1-acyl-sn-glycerol-3-phosphate acyltransferase